MNYKKMRKILIVMLIFTNFIMIFNLFSIIRNDNKIYEKMLNDNVTYLLNKGIYIDENLLKMETISSDALTYSSISRENIECIIENITSSENNLYIGENGTAKINDDGSFAINLNTSHSFDSIEQVLINSGFNIDSTFFEETENGRKYMLEIEDFLVSNCFFEVILNNNTTAISGNFVFGEPQATKGDDNFSSFLAIAEICNYYDYSGEISDITFEYKLSNVNNQQVLPVFVVNTVQNVFYYNIFDNSITKF
ncbi:MAG: hypothetical protein R3Y09_09535 [Clostridia bacterium]